MQSIKASSRRRSFLTILLIAICAVAAVALIKTRFWTSQNSWRQMTIFLPSLRVHNFQAMDELFPARAIHRGTSLHRFAVRERTLPPTYTFRGKTRNLDAFLDRTTTTGLFVLEGDTIVAERYYRGARADSPLTSWSMAKSVVSTLVGIAHDEHLLEDLTMPLGHYAPELRGSAYGNVPLHDALTMSSGIDFDERYQAVFSEINTMFARIFYLGEGIPHYLAGRPRRYAPGEHFHYASTDTLALGLALRRAVNMPLTSYLENKIWKPLGMEYDGFWNVESDDGAELAFCCLNVRLRDWAKIGRLLARRGDWDGQRIVSEAWIDEATRIEPARAPGKVPRHAFGYQYQWWIPAGERGAFMAVGIWSQYMYINPKQDLVIVKTSVDPDFALNDDEHVAVFEAIEDALR